MTKKITFCNSDSEELKLALRKNTRYLLMYCYMKNLMPPDAEQFTKDIGKNCHFSRFSVHRWYRRFRAGDFSLRDHVNPGGRPAQKSDEELAEIFHQAIDENPMVSITRLRNLGKTNFLRTRRILHNNLGLQYDVAGGYVPIAPDSEMEEEDARPDAQSSSPT